MGFGVFFCGRSFLKFLFLGGRSRVDIVNILEGFDKKTFINLQWNKNIYVLLPKICLQWRK